MKTALRTHVGRVRQVNEDSAWVDTLGSGLIAAVVADGMGGHKAGEIASGLTVESVVASLSSWQEELGSDAAAIRLKELIRRANSVVYETASGNDQYSNMGTTIVLALLDPNAGLIGHIGDSRAYRLRAGELLQLTEDHTLVHELTKSGQLSPEEAATHPRRNVLMRALGTDLQVEVDVLRFDWLPGDLLLLCSDGLSSLVEEHLIKDTLTEASSNLEQKAERLIALALLAGGDDNVTVALVEHEPDVGVAGGGKA
ncbi:Stp1/IreP family PP2C-type Ser/Thr phosphatase [Cohnella fermenti]|uniref:Stp1/IreP family PP2C-type Ser/Thr phosphatase n=1 Tax=Cohnella fermenti TaxID=2565925 RepID=A0A4S4BFX3_9BACL|nr:Stp1/IreP family PP2C-type Ser/Thr phosphatase [Cohnella fermenti]THF73276.1 Stp1/IreP family PP2C-type Ser/Thr phosphatase [Cohnella fermenti]